MCPTQSSATPPPLCGSGLAREEGVSVEVHVAGEPHSRASPLPQGFVLGQAFLVRGRKIANTPNNGRNEHR
ncbi:hypothetical protein C1X65_03855 [Pseudomonas sp. FW305-70]|nr:hypothetical protein C1X65_03855 [Pseudomonas sp. FW305-70]